MRWRAPSRRPANGRETGKFSMPSARPPPNSATRRRFAARAMSTKPWSTLSRTARWSGSPRRCAPLAPPPGASRYWPKSPRRLRILPPKRASCGLHSAHLADELPFVSGDRLHRQAALFHQHHVLELRLGLDGGERHRLRQCLDRAGGHGDPGLVFFSGRIGKGLAEDFADADDLLLVAGVIEEKFLALLHRLQMLARREIAHAAPRLALLAALDLVIPGKFLRLRLHQPIRHRHSSAFNGRVSKDLIASSNVIVSASSAATAAAIGMSTERSRAISSSTGAVKAPSARPVLMVPGFWPWPRLTPNWKLRDCGLEQVNSKSPRPLSPIMVCGLAPKALPKRVSSAKPRVVSAAPALAPRPRPVTTPAAIASTFLVAPPISTPRISVE